MAYGVEVTASNGSKYYIPDSNPYTFFRKESRYVPPDQGRFLIPIPDVPYDANTRVFVVWHTNHYQGNGACTAVRANGVWNLAVYINPYNVSNTFEAYIFTDRAGPNQLAQSPAYGVQFFDANGNIVLNNVTKPLKISKQPRNTHPGFKIATEAQLVECRKSGGPGWEFRYMDVFVNNTMYETFILVGTAGASGLYNFSLPEYNYINCADYD